MPQSDVSATVKPLCDKCEGSERNSLFLPFADNIQTPFLPSASDSKTHILLVMYANVTAHIHDIITAICNSNALAASNTVKSNIHLLAKLTKVVRPPTII